MLLRLGESGAKCTKTLGQRPIYEYEPEGAVHYSREDSNASQAVGPEAWSPANEHLSIISQDLGRHLRIQHAQTQEKID